MPDLVEGHRWMDGTGERPIRASAVWGVRSGTYEIEVISHDRISIFLQHFRSGGIQQAGVQAASEMKGACFFETETAWL